ncbi:hypothetical protein ACP70R_042106 [Stipagrostis hirtigluma subsp. patula]
MDSRSLEYYLTGSDEQWRAPALESLLPDLSREEQLRLQNQFRERERRWKRYNKNSPLPTPPDSERQRDYYILPHAHHALHHYNAKHPGDEFDVVKPLMASHVGFKGQAWFHVNFWARSRASNKIKRFFAEVHYKPSTTSFVNMGSMPLPLPIPIPIIETCTIIEEPLSQYKSTCAFCPGEFDILHPKGCRKFVCGNDKDRKVQRLTHCKTGLGFELPFTCRPDSAPSPNCHDKEEDKREF